MNVSLRFLRVCFILSISIVLCSCGSSLGLNEVAYIQFIQESSGLEQASFNSYGDSSIMESRGPQDQSERRSTTQNIYNYPTQQDSIYKKSEFCQKNPSVCDDNASCLTGICDLRIVIGSCAMSSCNGDKINKLIKEAYLKTITYYFTESNNSLPTTTISLDQDSKKLLFSNNRFALINFIKPRTAYNVSATAEGLDGKIYNFEIKNMTFSK